MRREHDSLRRSLVLTVLVVIASLGGNHEHRILTALASNVLDLLMLAFALAGAFYSYLAAA